MFISAMRVQFVIPIKSLSAEATLGMSLEPTLVNRSGIIIAEFLMFFQFIGCKQVVLMRENLLISCTEVTHNLVMQSLDVLMKIRPSKASNVAFLIGAVISQKQNSVFKNVWLFVFDPESVILSHKVCIREIFVSFRGIIGEDDMLSVGLNISVSKWLINRTCGAYLLYSVHKLLSCTIHAIAKHICDKFDGCMARLRCAQQVMRK
jgi:hypothetical protein